MSARPASRNAPCPCGSGRRYKDCHGALETPLPTLGAGATMLGSAPAGSATLTPVPATDLAVESVLERARAALATGDTAQVERMLQQVLAADPDNAEANFYAGNVHRERGEVRAAIACYERALRVAQANAATLNNLGLALEAVGDRDAALDCYRKVLAVDPSHFDALGNAANALFEKHDFRASADAYARLFAIRRELPVAIVVRRGIALKSIGRLDEAEACLREAARREPDDVRILARLGALQIDRTTYDAAEATLARARELDPHNGFVLSLLAHSRAQCCAWDGIDDLFGEIARVIDAPPHEYWRIAPLQLLAMPLPPQALRRAAALWGSAFAQHPAPPRPAPIPASDGRLRVGFASSDFRLHPVASVITEVLERLDRSRIEVFAYGLQPADTGPVGRRIASAVDHFSDLTELSSFEAVRYIRADGIAILFDLNGYTGGNRLDLFAHRAAPLQINSIGFSGTLGVDWYDYIHVDAFVAPEGAQPHYAERFFRMPYSYYPSDTTRSTHQPAPKRGDYGLPADALVFCTQASPYKILPPVFDVWMRLLSAIPRSVLWLRPMSPSTQTNLRAEANRRGVAPGRLVFAPLEANPVYLARYALADLYVDTYPFGSHTTVNDALYAGLPVITLVGETLASRSSGSQLHAIGLPELATSTLGEYETLALALARDRERLAALRTRLVQNRRSRPLFDMTSYTRDLEDGLLEIWRRHAAESRSTPD